MIEIIESLNMHRSTYKNMLAELRVLNLSTILYCVGLFYALITGCLAAALASTEQMLVSTHIPSCDNQKCVPALPDAPGK